MPTIETSKKRLSVSTNDDSPIWGVAALAAAFGFVFVFALVIRLFV